MPAPYQVTTSTANTALDYAPQQRIATLCDGSQVVVVFDGSTSAKLVQITNPSGASPTMTALTQTFSISGAGNVVASLFVLHNGAISDDVWLAYADNNTGNRIAVAHATYTASGAVWSWDNTGTTVVSPAGGFSTATICWNGTDLIVLGRYNGGSSYTVGIWYTTTKNGSAGWSATATLASASSGSSHFYPLLLHDATTGCTLAVYTLQGDTVVARVLADSAATAAVANWSAEVALSGTVNVGASNLAATLDAANARLHVAWCHSATAPNPAYVTATYTTTSITPGTPFDITGGGGTGATSPAVGLDAGSPPKAYLFWASAAGGTASDISYVTIASPYGSGNASAVTNQTNASANDNVFPHVPMQDAMSGYVPLIYARSATSPFAVEFDNTITASAGGTPRSLAGEADGVSTATAALAVGQGFSGESDGASTANAILTHSVPLAGASSGVATASGVLSAGHPGTGIGDLAVSTKTQTWPNSTTGAGSGTETDISYQDASGGGWTWGIIPTYGGDLFSSKYERDGGSDGANQASLTTTTSGGHVHWLEQNGVGGFAGSEDNAFTLTELAPTGTAFRRYYKGTFGPDSNGFNWSVTACVYPGDPGFVAYRYDCINPTSSAIALAGSDGMEIALVGSMEQADATWTPANGFYGQVGGTPTSGWPSALTLTDPDYVGITPAVASGLTLGFLTVKQQRVTAYSPAWANAQIQYLQNTSRLKLKVQGDLSSFPGSATQTVYLLLALRRNLTSSDAAAIAADYLAPGVPTVTAGSFTSYSYDEGAYVFAASGSGAAAALGATLDLSPAHVTARYKPRLKVTGWTGGEPRLTWGGSPLTNGVDYRHFVDTANAILYLQLYYDVVASGAVAGQRNNAALGVSPAWVGQAAGVSTAAATLTVSHALVGESDGVATAAAALTVSHTLAGAANGAATASASLTVTHALAGESDGVSTATAGLLTGHGMSGESDGLATASATLTISHSLSGEADGASTASATLAIGAPAVQLAGMSSGQATAVALLTLTHLFAGAAAGVSGASASLSVGLIIPPPPDGVAVALTSSGPQGASVAFASSGSSGASVALVAEPVGVSVAEA